MFRKRKHRNGNGRMTPQASLAEAEASRRIQERKREAETPVRRKLDKLIEENHLAELMREALGRG